VDRLASADPRVTGTVAFIDLLDELARPSALERLSRRRRVVGVRQNIQGHPPGFCLDDRFVRGAQAVGRQGLTFDLCATEGQLPEVASLVERCPDTMFVLDHCGKPAIAREPFEPWATSITRLASCNNVWCKLSGLLTEAPEDARSFDVLQPYAHHVLSAFGVQRLMYGSDWPVVTLAGGLDAWLAFTERFTKHWPSADRERFYSGSAIQFYDLRLDAHV
jgi:L-fuconolactonase